MLTCTPKKALTRLLLPAVGVEVLMGVSYLGVILLQIAESPWSYFFYYLYLALHFVITMGVIVLALYYFDRRERRAGFLTLGIYLAALTLKDLVGNLSTYAIAEGYEVLDALGIAALQTLLSSLLLEGAILAFVTGLAYLLFLWGRPASPDHERAFDLATSPLTRAQLFVILAYGTRRLITLTVDCIKFGRQVFWMMTGAEIATIVWDFLFLFALLFLAYLASSLMRRALRVPPVPPTPLSGFTPKKKT